MQRRFLLTAAFAVTAADGSYHIKDVPEAVAFAFQKNLI